MELDSNCVEADVNLGNILHGKGELSSDKQIHYAELNYKLGLARKKAGDLQIAKVYFQKALELNPTYEEACNILEQIDENRQKSQIAKPAVSQKVQAN